MSTQSGIGSQGPLQIDRRTTTQLSQIGALQRFRYRIKLQNLAVDRHDSQAAPVDTDAVPDVGIRMDDG